MYGTGSPPPRDVYLVGVEVAAKRYDVSSKTIRRHIADGKITAYRVGHLVKVDLYETDRILLRPIGSVDVATLAQIREHVRNEMAADPPPPLTAHQQAVVSAMFSGRPMPVDDGEVPD